MIVRGTCIFCKETHWKDLDITSAQMCDWQGGTLIQVAMPQLDDDEREFLVSGSHKNCFEEAFDE